MPETISIGMAERLARAFEEGFLAACAAQCVGADDAYAVGAHVAQPLAEALEAGQRARRNVLVQPPVGLEAGAEPHHLAQAIEDDELAVRVTRDHHVETVGTEIDRGEDVRDGLRCAPRHVSVDCVRRRTRSRSRRWSARSDCGSRTARHRGLRDSRSPRRSGTGCSSGSTSSFTPRFSTQVSPSCSLSSNSNPYCMPEQPPPCTKTRSIRLGLPSPRIRSPTLRAAASVKFRVTVSVSVMV